MLLDLLELALRQPGGFVKNYAANVELADVVQQDRRADIFDPFRAGAVRLVLDEGKTVGAVARDLDLTPSARRVWVTRARADRTKGRTGLTTAEREELARLRKETRELRTERDILKKPRPSSRSTRRKVWLDCRGEGRLHGGGVLWGVRRLPEWVQARGSGGRPRDTPSETNRCGS